MAKRLFADTRRLMVCEKDAIDRFDAIRNLPVGFVAGDVFHAGFTARVAYLGDDGAVYEKDVIDGPARQEIVVLGPADSIHFNFDVTFTPMKP